MKSNLISKSETGAILASITREWDGITQIKKVKNLKVYSLDDGSQIMTGSDTKIARTRDGRHMPLLSETATLDLFPHVIVDMGAVRFVCKGANLMRPGIKEFGGTFEKDDLVCIKDESQGKYLAVGIATIPSDAASEMQKGQVLENLHYISDAIWEASKEIRD